MSVAARALSEFGRPDEAQRLRAIAAEPTTGNADRQLLIDIAKQIAERANEQDGGGRLSVATSRREGAIALVEGETAGASAVTADEATAHTKSKRGTH